MIVKLRTTQQREADLAEFVSLLMDALAVDEVADTVTTIVMENYRARQMAKSGQTVIPLTDTARARPPGPISGRGQLKGRSPR